TPKLLPWSRKALLLEVSVLDINTALRDVLKTALNHDVLAHENSKVAKAFNKYLVQLCVFASNGDEPMYIGPVKALCAEHKISLIRDADKTDQEGKPSNVVVCGSVGVKDYGKECHPRYFKSKK
ncbi:40S ribosomal protein S12, partial [Lemmus lemmus]